MMARTLSLLALLLTGALAAAAPTAGVLPYAASGAGFEQALTAREFEFPRDHAAHPAFQHEWWYFTGHLRGTHGERFGFELTFFRIALAPQQAAVAAGGASRWHARQFYVAHFAVTDIARAEFHASARYARDALGLAGARAEPLQVWLDNWTLSAVDAHWQLHAAEAGWGVDLALVAAAPAVANGERGLSRKSALATDASYYYSIPRLSVHGELTRDGQALSVTGEAWLDREWGSGALAADEAGWDWFGLQLSDGSELMFYGLRRRDGTLDVHSAGTFVAPDGRVRALKSADVELTVQRYWTSPRGGRYPARWHLSVPALRLSVDVEPALADQELPVRPRYWEGAVDLAGTRAGASVRGEGYVELVGYARGP